jgi:hypothetical protein
MHELISLLQSYALKPIMTIKFVSITNKNRSSPKKNYNSFCTSASMSVILSVGS